MRNFFPKFETYFLSWRKLFYYIGLEFKRDHCVQYGHIFSTIVSQRTEAMLLTFLNFGFPIWALITLQALGKCVLGKEMIKIDPGQLRILVYPVHCKAFKHCGILVPWGGVPSQKDVFGFYSLNLVTRHTLSGIFFQCLKKNLRLGR